MERGRVMYPVKYFLNTDYQAMEVLGVKGLFTNLRVESASLPEGFYKYSIREGEDDFFSTLERSVLVNHSGDFICKQELDLGEQGCKDLGEDYSFLDEPVDVGAFFGVDVLTKLAETLDSFMKDFDPYEYADNLNVGEENMVGDIRSMLDDREQVEGILNELKEILDDGQAAFDAEANALVDSLIDKIEDVVRSFPVPRAKLAAQIDAAEIQKAAPTGDEERQEQVVSEP